MCIDSVYLWVLFPVTCYPNLAVQAVHVQSNCGVYGPMKKNCSIFALTLACASLLPLAGCGGGSVDKVVTAAKMLAGKIFAKLTGITPGQITAEVTSITKDLSEISGTIDLNGDVISFTGPVNTSDGSFSATFGSVYPGTQAGRNTGLINGKIVMAADGSLSISNGTVNGMTGPAPGAASNTLVSFSDGIEDTAGAGIVAGTLPNAAACEWNATSFYNAQQVATYQGRGYTAKQAVVPFGNAGAVLFNPASDSFNWTPGGSCGPTPFVKVVSAKCTKGATADLIEMTGTAYGGGVGDAITSYSNVTDLSASSENSFGLARTQYSMTCKYGGFVGIFTSSTSPSYSVCVKTQASADVMEWTSTQTLAHSTTLTPLTTAYASKGSPLRATVFNVGSIILGFDAVRSAGYTMTGNCN